MCIIHCFNEGGRKAAFKEWKKELKKGVNHMKKKFPLKFNVLFQYNRVNANKLYSSPL
jgi:hypothetical protein